jgi:hypothetical protein
VLFPGYTLVSVLNTLGFIGIPILSYYMLLQFRNRGLGGYIRFGQAWSFGVWLYFFAGLIMSVVYFLHFKVIDPDYISKQFNQTVLLLEQMHYNQDMINTIAESDPPTAIQLVISYLFAYIIGSAILYLILSPLVVRKRPSFNQPTPKKESDSDQTNYPDLNA